MTSTQKKMSGIIFVRDIKIYAYHGCLEEEELIGGNYIVDVKIYCDYSEAAKNDDLSKTVDYCEVYEIVKFQMKIRSKLIENAAQRIADSLKRKIRRIVTKTRD